MRTLRAQRSALCSRSRLYELQPQLFELLAFLAPCNNPRPLCLDLSELPASVTHRQSKNRIPAQVVLGESERRQIRSRAMAGFRKAPRSLGAALPIWPVSARRTARQPISRKRAFYALRLTRLVAQGLDSRKSQLFIQS